MFVRITLPAYKGATGYCGAKELLTFFRDLGFEILPKKDATGAISETVEIELNGVKTSVLRYTETYYQDQASRNLENEVSSEVRKEISSAGVYFGAISSLQSYLAVTRTSDSEITLLIFHEKLENVIKGAEEFFRRINKGKNRKRIFSYKTIYSDASIEMISDQAPKLIAKAALGGSTIGRFLSEKSIEISVLSLTLILDLFCLFVNKTPAPASPLADIFPQVFRLFADKAWTSLTVSSCVLMLTLSIGYLKAPRKLITWKWN